MPCRAAPSPIKINETIFSLPIGLNVNVVPLMRRWWRVRRAHLRCASANWHCWLFDLLEAWKFCLVGVIANLWWFRHCLTWSKVPAFLPKSESMNLQRVWFCLLVCQRWLVRRYHSCCSYCMTFVWSIAWLTLLLTPLFYQFEVGHQRWWCKNHALLIDQWWCA